MQNAGTNEFLTLVKDARNILVLLRPEADFDECATALVLRDLFDRERKPHTVVGPGFDGKLDRMRSFIVSVDTTRAGLSAFAQEIRGEKLYLRITPKDGLLAKSDIEVGETEWRFDLVIKIGDFPTPDIHQAFFDQAVTITLSGDNEELMATLRAI